MNNLWDKEWIFGGFLGGFVVVLVVGLIVFESGLDIGGFICNLVYYCGVYGYKFIFDVVFQNGYLLFGMVFMFDIVVVGLMVCSVEDLVFFMDFIVGVGLLDVLGWKFNLLCLIKIKLFDYCVVFWLMDLILLVFCVVVDWVQMVGDKFVWFGVMVLDMVCFDFIMEEVMCVYFYMFNGVMVVLMFESYIEVI